MKDSCFYRFAAQVVKKSPLDVFSEEIKVKSEKWTDIV